VRKVLGLGIQAPRRHANLALEQLEDRVTPASLTDLNGTLTITLDNPGETLTIAAVSANHYSLNSSANAIFNNGLIGAGYSGTTTSGTLAIASDTTIDIIDRTTATSVVFGNGAAVYAQAVNVALTNPLSGAVSFLGTSTFGSGLAVRATNGVISDGVNAALHLTGGDLSLATNQAINLLGAVTAPNAATLQANGAITANNAGNQFGTLSLSGNSNVALTPAQSANIKSGASAVTLSVIAISGDLTLTTGGDIVQDFNGITIGGKATFAAGGTINLNDSAGFGAGNNTIGGDISASVTGAGNITLDVVPVAAHGVPTITLGSIALGAGGFTLIDDDQAGSSLITEDPVAGGITSAGTVTVNIATDANANVRLDTVANNLSGGAGAVAVTGSGFVGSTSGDFGLRNTSAAGGAAQLVFGNFAINNLTLEFDDPSVGVDVAALATLPLLGGSFHDVTVTAGGAITQSFGVNMAGNVSFTSITGAITLGDSTNQFSGDISAAVSGANTIQIDNGAATTTLGKITLGSGPFTLNDDGAFGTSTIAEDPGLVGGGITSSGTIAINVLSDAAVNIDLNQAANNLAGGAGSVTITGTGGGTSGDFGLRNSNPAAGLAQVSFVNFTIGDLTLEFDDAGVSLNVASLASLPLDTAGVFSNLSVTVGGNLTHAAAINVTGNLAETAGGTITQAATGAITAGSATFSVLGNTGGIDLSTDINNAISGGVSFDTPATNVSSVALVNNGNVVLGSSALGSGNFSVTAGGAGSITELGGSTITQVGAGAIMLTAGGASIDLSTGNQNRFNGPLVFLGNAVTSVGLENANPQAALFDPGLATLTSLNLVYDGPLSSILLPLVPTNVAYNLSLKETGNIVLPAGAALAVTGNHNLLLDSTSGRINLIGSVANTIGTTTLQDESTTGSISASSAANLFGTLAINGAALNSTVVAAGTVTLGNSNLTGAGTFSLTAGAIAQAGGASITTTTEALNFTATAGNIALGNANNALGGAIAARVTGNKSISLSNSNATTTIGTISLGTGALTLTDNDNSGTSTIQETGGGVTTSGPISITIANDAMANVDLSGAPNNIAAGVAVSITGITAGTQGILGIRDINPAADLSQLTLSHFQATDLTLTLDNSSINAGVLPLFNSNLRLTAGGSITQSGGALAAPGTAAFTLLGDGSITLTNANNNISGVVSFSAVNADNKQQIVLTNHGDINLGASSLGLASVTLTANANLPSPGNIIANAAVTQAAGGGPILLNAAGTTIALDPASGNFFSGVVVLDGTLGSNLTTIGFENDSPLANLPTLSGVAPALASIRFDLPNAPVVLPVLPSTTTLTVNAGGNVAQLAPLTVTGEAFITTTGGYAIQLNDASNSIHEVSLNNSGQNAVALTTTGALLLDDSSVGAGAVSLFANGPITQTGGAGGFKQVLGPNDAIAGMAIFAAGANPILLDNPNNSLIGPVTANANGPTGNVTIVNSGALILGASGGESLSVTSLAGAIAQAPGTQVQVQGNAFFSAPGNISLTNSNNAISGLISINGATASLRLNSAAQLDTSIVTNGPLNITALGTITQAVGLLDARGANFITSHPVGVNITLAATDFHDQPVTIKAGSGTISVADVDPNGLNLGSLTFGVGGLSITAAGPITQVAGSAITGSGPVSIVDSAASAFGVTLDQASNNISGGAGAFTLGNISNLTLVNQGNIALGGTFGLKTVSDNGDVHLTAGGAVTLPSGVLTVGSLAVSANQTTISANLISTDANGFSFTGAVAFTTAAVLDVSAGGALNFNGNVTASQAVVIDLPSSGQVTLSGGTWSQGANALTINGTQATFTINAGATFTMTGGALNMTGITPALGAPSANNNINVLGAFNVGGNVNIGDGGTDSVINLAIFGTLQVLLGNTPGALNINGVNPGDQVELFGTLSGYGGTAPAGNTTILSVSGGGSIVNTFSNPTDAGGNFFMGSDIVKGTYSDNSLTIQQTPAGATTVSGNFVNGDGYKVAVTGGSNLVVIAPFGSVLDIVVRTASAPTTLTVTATTNGGNGYLNVGGIAIDGPGAATISAGKANLTGNVTVAGPLTALTVHDWNAGALTGGGTSTQMSTITGDVFTNVAMNLGTTLSALTVAEVTGPNSSIRAASFGSIKATGNRANHTPGNFSANLLNTNQAAANAMTTATISGALSGLWELAGAVGTVTAEATNNFSLGVPNGANVANGGLVTNVTTLNLGVATGVNVFASGNVTTLTAVSLVDNGGLIQANSFGTIKTTGSTGADHGNFVANITALGNAGGTSKSAIGTLTVAGNLGQGTNPLTLLAKNGNIGTITIGGAMAPGVSINDLATVNGGAITSITAGAWQGAALAAQSVGTLKIIGNLANHLLGNFTGAVALTGTGSASAISLGTFSTSGDVSGTFTILNGGVTTFIVGGAMTQSSINMQSTSTGIGTIAAAEWVNDTLNTQSIGTLKATGRAASAGAPALNGDIFSSDITSFGPIGATPGIGTFSVAGALANGGSGNYFILANNGITTLSVGRDISSEQIVSNNGGAAKPGMGTITAGAWNNSDLQAYQLGTFTIKGFTTPELSGAFVPGSLQNSNIVVFGPTTPTKPGIATLTITGNLTAASFNVPFGIGILSVTGLMQGDVVDLRNALVSTSGVLGTLTAGGITQTMLYVNSAGAIKTTGNAALGLNGDFSQSTLAAATGLGSPLVGVGTLAIAGNLSQAYINIKDGMTTFSVVQTVTSSNVAAAYDATNPSIKTLTAGRWSNTNLVANSIGTFSVTGNAGYFLAGDFTNSRVTILRSQSGVGLGTFTASGHVSQASFQVTSGNVTSFTAGYFIGSTLLVGYVPVDGTDLYTNVSSDQQSGNWQGIFTLGTFKTTAVLNINDVADTAGFQSSDVVAARLGAITLSGLNSTPLASANIVTFGVFSRHTGGTVGTLTVSGAVKPSPTTIGAFHYFGLGG
jgi:hypothetical protein